MLLPLILIAGCKSPDKSVAGSEDGIRIADNPHYFSTTSGDPFFWLGDTGWLLFVKTDREEAEKYLETRKQQGFNVIQVMVLHSLGGKNVYGDAPLIEKDAARPDTTAGNLFTDSLQYDFWDHVDYIVDKAAEKGIYMALVPVWGSNVKSGGVSVDQANAYAPFLADRYKNRSNIIWLNGGDIKGTDSTDVWDAIGNTLRRQDPHHLIGFHPFGRTQSSTWLHDAPWLDFNMFQSGHRTYAQDTARGAFGEDNWRYVAVDYQKTPVKPTLDGEPSYEGIPHGLHDSTQPRWKDADLRRYAYWSVFAGSAGFTYGANAIMQFHRATEPGGAYGVQQSWQEFLDAPGATQMVHLKALMLSRPYFERIPDQSVVADQGERYNYQVATRGKDYAFIYTYNGRNIKVNMGKTTGDQVEATWYSPRDGATTAIGDFPNKGVQEFDPPGEQEDGNDWVLKLDSK